MKSGCVISVADENTAAMVRSVLLLGGIDCSGGDVLVTDHLPEKSAGFTGIILLSRSRVQEVYSVPVMVLRPPLRFDELLAEVRGLLERTGEQKPGTAESDVHEKNDGEDDIQIQNACISYRGKQAQLTERESRLFTCLAGRGGKIVTRRELLDEVWDGADGETNVTDVYISYLRRKLTPLFGQGVLLTVRGQGYILHLPDTDR